LVGNVCPHGAAAVCQSKREDIFLKSTTGALLTIQKKLDKVTNRINATPMICLGFKTPAEVFVKCGGVAFAS
jgi:hypothetical protein